MISTKEIQAQLQRVAHMPGYPKAKEAIADLYDAFACLELAWQAKKVIDRWIEMPALDLSNRPQAPTVVDLKRLCRVVADELPPQKRSGAPCELCGDSGWMQAWELHTWDRTGQSVRKQVQRISREQYQDLLPKVGYDPGRQAVIECAARCTCSIGQRRAAAAEAERGAA